MGLNELIISSLSAGSVPIELEIRRIASAKSKERIAYYAFPKVNSASLGVLMPRDYEAVVNRNAIGCMYTEWTLRHLLEPICRAVDRGSDFMFTAVDTSLRALSDERLVGILAEYDERLTKEARSGICLTFGSDILFSEHPETRSELKRLRDRGYMVGLKDFGSDYCPTMRLSEFPVDAVFFESGFSDKLSSDPGTYRSLVGYVNSLGCFSVLCGGAGQSELGDLADTNGCDGFLTDQPEKTIT